ncbi:MAG TPA: hypothetical protein VK921_05310 [Anditalea sp.]|nr:hypothetical protein [Anditalea sp.]
MKDFNELKEGWNKVSQHQVPVSDEALEERLKKVTTAQNHIKRIFKIEILVSLAIFLVFILFLIFKGGIEPFFIKIIGIILLCSVPVYLRFFISLKKIMGIDYTNSLKSNLIRAKDYLKNTIIIYYIAIAIMVVLLALMSWTDDFFKNLDNFWKVGIMVYYVAISLSYAFIINKNYGSRLRDIENLLNEK